MTSSNQSVARSTSSDALSLLTSSVRKPTTSLDESGFASLLFSSAASEPAPEPRRREERSPEARANDRHEDRSRSQNDRAEQNRVTDKREAADDKPTDADVSDPNQVTPIGVPVDEASASTAGAETISSEKTSKAARVDETKTAAADKTTTNGQTTGTKAVEETTKSNATDTSVPKLDVDASATATADAKPDDKKATTKTDENAIATVVPVATPLATTKPTSLKADKISLDSKFSDKQAPLPGGEKLPGQTAAVPTTAGADGAAATSTPGTADADTKEAAGTPIKSLGHETAKAMAKAKTETRDAAKPLATQPAAAQAQPAAQNARAAAPTTQAFASVDALSSDSTQTTSNGQLISTSTTSPRNAATIRIGTLPGQSQPTQVPAMAIALQMSRNLQRGSSSFEIRLDPAELGRVDVRMEVRKDGHVTAHLTIDKPETLDLLQRDARALQQALNDAGLQADSDSLNFSLRDQSAGGDGSSNESANANGSFGNDRGVDGSEAAAAQPSLYNVNLSATGGIDIRI